MFDELKKHCNKLRHNCYKCEHKKTICPIIQDEKRKAEMIKQKEEGK